MYSRDPIQEHPYPQEPLYDIAIMIFRQNILTI